MSKARSYALSQFTRMLKTTNSTWARQELHRPSPGACTQHIRTAQSKRGHCMRSSRARREEKQQAPGPAVYTADKAVFCRTVECHPKKERVRRREHIKQRTLRTDLWSVSMVNSRSMTWPLSWTGWKGSVFIEDAGRRKQAAGD